MNIFEWCRNIRSVRQLLNPADKSGSCHVATQPHSGSGAGPNEPPRSASGGATNPRGRQTTATQSGFSSRKTVTERFVKNCFRPFEDFQDHLCVVKLLKNMMKCVLKWASNELPEEHCPSIFTYRCILSNFFIDRRVVKRSRSTQKVAHLRENYRLLL